MERKKQTERQLDGRGEKIKERKDTEVETDEESKVTSSFLALGVRLNRRFDIHGWLVS